ncbi:MAG TPA: hypothetical protein VJ437_08655 [Acidiferrobacterales bacterium]|nr:hypothetical protein [Acidiferrobacterales bacterium]
MPGQDARGILSGHGIDANPKEKAFALEAVGQKNGAFKITSGKLLDAVLGGTIPDQTREDLQAVKVLQDLFGAPDALFIPVGLWRFALITDDQGRPVMSKYLHLE